MATTTTATESKKMITLYSSDGEVFEIEESVAKKFRKNSKKPEVHSITLRSCDDEEFVIDESEGLESETIKFMFEYDCAESGIHLPSVEGEVLSKVVDYLEMHAFYKSEYDEKTADEEIKAWDAEFVKFDRAMLFHLIVAADYLGIDSLENLASAQWMRECMSPLNEERGGPKGE